VISALYGGFSSPCVEAVKWPNGPFEAFAPVVLVTTPRFAQAISTASVKAMGDPK
jgi:hypothetical protein